VNVELAVVYISPIPTPISLEIGVVSMCKHDDMNTLCRLLAKIYGLEKYGTLNALHSLSFQQFRRRCIFYIRKGSDSMSVLVAYLEGGYRLEYKKRNVHVFRCT
jgi:hypothetical protein